MDSVRECAMECISQCCTAFSLQSSPPGGDKECHVTNYNNASLLATTDGTEYFILK